MYDQMDYPKFIVSNQKKRSISIQRVKIENILLYKNWMEDHTNNQAKQGLLCDTWSELQPAGRFS